LESADQRGAELGAELVLQRLGLGGKGATGTGAAVAPTSSPGVSIMINAPAIFAAKKQFTLPSHFFGAYHEGFCGFPPAQRIIATSSYTRLYDNSHAKFWGKMKHVVYNIYTRVRDDDNWSVVAATTGTDAAHSVCRNRLALVLEEVDAEFKAWSSEGTAAGAKARTLLERCQQRVYPNPFAVMKAPKQWHERLWPESDSSSDDAGVGAAATF
jgi:hypothetical protein